MTIRANRNSAKITAHLSSCSANLRIFPVPCDKEQHNSDPDRYDDQDSYESKQEHLEKSARRSGRLGKQPDKSRGRILLAVEAHQLPCIAADQQLAQQPIVEGVTGLVGAE